jgi:hypothetical protein
MGCVFLSLCLFLCIIVMGCARTVEFMPVDSGGFVSDVYFSGEELLCKTTPQTTNPTLHPMIS